MSWWCDEDEDEDEEVYGPPSPGSFEFMVLVESSKFPPSESHETVTGSDAYFFVTTSVR